MDLREFKKGTRRVGWIFVSTLLILAPLSLFVTRFLMAGVDRYGDYLTVFESTLEALVGEIGSAVIFGLVAGLISVIPFLLVFAIPAGVLLIICGPRCPQCRALVIWKERYDHAVKEGKCRKCGYQIIVLPPQKGRPPEATEKPDRAVGRKLLVGMISAIICRGLLELSDHYGLAVGFVLYVLLATAVLGFMFISERREEWRG